ncbi:MAG TPA: hypothetical protein QF753_13460 [Victivallales bacterium]|nr:hypothetical protein [Victivallales bacterium]
MKKDIKNRKISFDLIKLIKGVLQPLVVAGAISNDDLITVINKLQFFEITPQAEEALMTRREVAELLKYSSLKSIYNLEKEGLIERAPGRGKAKYFKSSIDKYAGFMSI